MDVTQPSSRKADVRFIASMLLFIGLMGVTPVLAVYLGFSGLRILPLLIPAMAALVWMAREARLRGERSGCITPAARAYNRRVLPLMILYMIAIVVSVTIHRHGIVAGPMAYLLALVPALPLLGVIWAMARFFTEEEDEYQRAQLARRALIATAFTLSAATIWGFLEQFELVAHLPSYWAFIVWCMGLGLAQIVDKFR